MTARKGTSIFLAVASAAVFAFAGCSKEAPKETSQAPASPAAPATPGGEGQGQGQLPQGHPAVEQNQITMAAHANLNTQKEVKLSDEVRNKWKEVKLEITNSATNAREAVDIKVGSAVALTKDGIKLKVTAFVPDYAITENRVITSRSNEPKNPAVLIELIEGDKTTARGWVFKDLPEFNSYKDARFPVALLAPGTAKPAKK